MLKFVILAIIAIFMLQSCATSGYGCKGTSKNMIRTQRYY